MFGALAAAATAGVWTLALDDDIAFGDEQALNSGHEQIANPGAILQGEVFDMSPEEGADYILGSFDMDGEDGLGKDEFRELLDTI